MGDHFAGQVRIEDLSMTKVTKIKPENFFLYMSVQKMILLIHPFQQATRQMNPIL